ncbi:hypothetical protein [Algoriphagus machipongonensis]|uniref:RiboL-PSP-HEPN domain-containing protein n=1 Tax=Algoriphagus machipongonensis TaxID=388413 RepID=A3HYS7_9BACT|nr:hypothetical protein [Algoriphagus machipongonensis]EAZ80413.1 hypothetical protein ALPR1_05805 [Algoriphagus machipongonensis]
MENRRSQKYWFLTDAKINYEFQFDAIKSYLNQSQSMIRNIESDLEKKYREWESERKTNPDLPEAHFIFEDEVYNHDQFSSILNESTFLTVYSKFESEFFSICEMIQHLDNLKIGPKDINSKGYIQQAYKYLKIVIGINLTSLNDKWREINFYGNIRNAIAHKRGRIDLNNPQNENLISFIEKSNGAYIYLTDQTIQIESINFVIQFIDLIIDFLVEVSELIINK